MAEQEGGGNLALASAAAARLHEKHQERPYTRQQGGFCRVDLEEWPCDVARVLEALDAALQPKRRGRKA